MSIINLEKTFENGQLIYFNIDNKIIECICLSELYQYNTIVYDNNDFGIFICNKVKVITIYDIYKNIIYKPIQIDLFNNSIKIGGILENLIRDVEFYKTFMRAFIENNKLNGIRYYIDDKGHVDKFLYDNISLEINNSIKIFNIYDNEGKRIYKNKYNIYFDFYYRNYNNGIKYGICGNFIKITKGRYPFYQTIYCNVKNLKLIEMGNYYEHIEGICEKRNDNNEITFYSEYNYIYDIDKFFILNDTNPPFSKPLRKIYIELINYYKQNINNIIESIEFCLKKEKEIYKKLSLYYKLEMINSK